MKTEGSNVLSHPAANLQHNAVTNRQQRRTTSGSAAKPLPPRLNSIHPPRSHSINSNTMSPVSAKSPHGVGKNGMSDGKSRPQPAIQPRTHPSNGFKQPPDHRSGASMQPMTPTSIDGNRGNDQSNPRTYASYYQNPEFRQQAHRQQLGISSSSSYKWCFQVDLL